MSTAIIQLSDVQFRWRKQDPLVLDIPELKVEVGKRIFIKGPSGSGKTTLLNLLGGVSIPEAGTLSVMGMDMTTLNPARRDAFRADHVGFIFQMFNLVPYLSLVDNVVLPCHFSARRRRKALDRSGNLEAEARRLLKHMELDVTSLASRPVSLLSIGQQQRVAAARSLIGAPALIIADEPTSSLDSDVQRSFLDILFREVGEAGASLLFVSHDSSMEAGFDQTIELATINQATPHK